MNTNNDQRPDLLGSVTGYAPQPWSEERPKAAGWWWWEIGPGRSIVVEVVPDGEGGFWVDTQNRLMTRPSAKGCGGRWCGPLPRPVEPSDGETGHIHRLDDSSK